MLYQISTSCQVCSLFFSYPVACEAAVVTEIRDTQEVCPYCGAQMAPYQVIEVNEPLGIVSEWSPRPAFVKVCDA